MSNTNELRVFISSTFRDLQEEREHLVKMIFPEVRALCRQRGVTFTEIDLRWGITEEEAEQEGVIRICLEEIDRCRPYFIGILGERYGWSPPQNDLHQVSDIFPELIPSLPDGSSITEMEMIYGVLANPDMAGRAFFYTRDPASTPEEFVDTDPEVVARLNGLKEQIRRSDLPLRENFKSPSELGSWIEEDLLQLIEQEYPEASIPTPLELERRAHTSFAQSRTRAYVPNPEYQQSFEKWITDGSAPLVVAGLSGLGKSSLLAYLSNSFQQSHPDSFVIEHYVGATHASGSEVSAMRHIMEEIAERFGIHEELPSSEEEIEKSFSNWLFRCEHLAKERELPVLIVIDALNQMGRSGRRMAWLPKHVPVGIRLMVSTTPGEVEERLVAREWDRLTVTPLRDETTRQEIVARYLGEFRKEISAGQLSRVTGDAKADSPLYLRLIAEELRIHGDHETLDETIDRYVGTKDLLALFEMVLERIEYDFGADIVRDLFSLIWCARDGLSERELMELTGLSRIALSRILFAADYHFLQRQGLLGFFHDFFRRAVERRHLLGEGRRSTHLRLAEYFERTVQTAIETSGVVPQRNAIELVYQLRRCEDWERLQTTLSTIPIFLPLYGGESKNEVLRLWRELGERCDVESSYHTGLERWRSSGAEVMGEEIHLVAELLENLGRWDTALSLQRERSILAQKEGDRSEEAQARTVIGRVLRLMGDYNGAFQEISSALDIFTELGDLRSASYCNAAVGNIHAMRGEFDKALACHHRVLSLTEELGDRHSMAIATINVGNVHSVRREDSSAVECYRRAQVIGEELGDLRLVTYANGNIGNVQFARGDYEQAIESYQLQVDMCDELGDPFGLSMAVGNIAGAYATLGEYRRALQSYEQMLEVCTPLGDRRGIARAHGNIGYVSLRLGEMQAAYEGYRTAVTAYREIGDRATLGTMLCGVAGVLLELREQGDTMPDYLRTDLPDREREQWQRVALQRAREMAEEAVATARELKGADIYYSGRLLLAQIDSLEGNTELAHQRLVHMLEEIESGGSSGGAADLQRKGEIHFWLWKLGLEPNIDHQGSATLLYTNLYAEKPDHEFRRRLDELQESKS